MTLDLSPPSTAKLDRVIVAREGLYEFARIAWAQIDPAPFLDNWHLELLCHWLEKWARGQVRDLVVNVPPNTGKSRLCATLFPAWVWTWNPTFAWITASHEQRLARRDSAKMRDLVQSPWWAQRWPEVSIPYQNTRSAMDYTNNQGGFRWATSLPRGSVTGRHADGLIVDDPTKPVDAYGRRAILRTEIDEANEWLHSTATGRLHPGAGRLVVMQRLHEVDMSAELIASSRAGAVHLRLPMRAEGELSCPIRAPHTCVPDPRDEGELLWAARFKPDEVAFREHDYGPRAVAAQLQQRPSPAGGGVFRREWFGNFWSELPEGGYWIQSWDMNFGGTSGRSHVVGTVWCADYPRFYLVDRVRGRWDFNEILEQVRALSAKWPQAVTKLVEDAAAGRPAVVTLQEELAGFDLVKPSGSKRARGEATTGLWKAGNVLLPADAPWVEEWTEEHVGFLGVDGEQNDQVDSGTQALLRLYTDGAASYAANLRAVRL